MNGGLQTVPTPIKYWKLALFKGINGWLIVVVGGLPAIGLVSVKVGALLILVFVQGGKFIEGFLDQEVSRAKEAVKRDTEFFYPANMLKAAQTATAPTATP